MAITPFLAKTLDCPALHLPLGQASDGAHLANERISLNNLHKGKDVIKKLFMNLRDLPKQKRPADGLALSSSLIDLRLHSNGSIQ
jgi:di- and tripeptidase